ncbi:Exonuclease RNase T and DNA polymerase III [Shewanella woodyi ATCC 51908]|uniref:Exonuclease RNase T and DNA polymerase III n=1 Tax=Shewanella woodyi (strain ATCC 51908 / MS32) TaxID=392500 RepID=B1KJ89_SHEWM|nr:Exonuclease RNase T and DNA polymerase III [Shewanella woodyi ATCC 51908]
MLSRYLLKSKLCWRAFRAEDQALKTYYHGQQSLLELDVERAPLLAIDLEMTGLDAQFDQILSIGIVPIEKGRLILSKAEHKLVKIEGSVGQSATIHGILDHHLNSAVSPEEAMTWFLERCQGQMLVAHHSPLDLAFLQKGLSTHFRQRVTLMAIDTLAIEKRRLMRQHEVLKEGALRLGASRARYGLPVYAAHNALIDAIACGELLLAQISAIGQGESVKLTELLA